MRIIKAIVIPADHEQPLRIEQIKQGDVEHYNRLVGGYIEAVNLNNPDCTLFLNEDGKGQQLPVNQRATAIWWVHNPVFIDQDFIVGDVVITGPPDGRGDDTGVPEQLIKLLMFTEAYRIEVQPTADGPWIAAAGRYTGWFAAYVEAIDVMKNWGLIEAARVVAA